MLHDIGKVHELKYSRTFGYTDEGGLIGHITIGVEMISEKVRMIEDFPDKLEMLLKHMILSHHGHYEYGSPKRPKTLESLLLYYLDEMNAKADMFGNPSMKTGMRMTTGRRIARYLKDIYSGGI